MREGVGVLTYLPTLGTFRPTQCRAAESTRSDRADILQMRFYFPGWAKKRHEYIGRLRVALCFDDVAS